MDKNLAARIKNLSLTSGVYLMKNADGKIIYIGKAVSLRKRVQSYFRPSGKKTMSKTDQLVEEIRDIDTIGTHSEAEALILEASLVKQHMPKYNFDLRDDKSYPYIEVTGEEFPRIEVSRPRVKNAKSKYFGPYTDAHLIREALTIIRKIFHFRTCDPFPKKECLDYHIGLCDAPCIQKISRKDYLRNIRNVILILEGKRDELYRDLRTDMEALSRENKFEEAAKVRDQIRAIGALYSGSADVNYYKEAEQLQRAIGLQRMPERIEGFDISNIMGNQSVGSMVSFLAGKPDKNNYRRFRIKEVAGIDDFKMIAEVVRRRYSRLKREGLPFPDLIMIDGGKGQLSAACEELEKLGVKIPIISLAKREEEIFLPGKRNSILLSKESLGLKLLQRLRDEAHRFALAYHRNLRAKNMLLRK
ncbi:MAG: excinuclease ABC subunit UvrC [Candidatus Omnitrophica bacterium]|nr:excinuclease ABC subunit UvrC [Candidatus Omnitrophota bacterium]